MADESRSSDSNKQTGGVTIGTIIGGIHNSIIAGRDVIIKVLGSESEERRAQRNRRAMLTLVKNIWVKGVLERSVHSTMLIELDLEDRTDAVERAWDMVLQEPDKPARLLPRGTKIIQVFDEMNGTLLILGAPGSGKTTMLLELARDTIARAEENPAHHIPVVFNLSSWTNPKQPIAEWLVDELNDKYKIPKRIARPWVENDDLLLLLDGLDEVRLKLREECVKAINDFRDEHGIAPLVICSRTADYEALTTRLKLQGAILLQPLTPQQIHTYLASGGDKLEKAHGAIRHSRVLQELAKSPLFLSIIALVYYGESLSNLMGTFQEVRKRLFEAYIQHRLELERAGVTYDPKSAKHWLSFVARMVSEHNPGEIFSIEAIQPTWLTQTQKRLYASLMTLVAGLTGGMIGGIANGVIANLIGGTVVGMFGAMVGAFAVAIACALFGGTSVAVVGVLASVASVVLCKAFLWDISTVILASLVSGSLIGFAIAVASCTTRRLNFFVPSDISDNEFLFRLVFGFITGSIAMMTIGLFAMLRDIFSPDHTIRLILGLLGGVLSGSILGLSVGPLVGSKSAKFFVNIGLVDLEKSRTEAAIVPRDTLVWSWRNSIAWFVIATALGWWLGELPIGISVGLALGMFTGVSGMESRIDTRIKPNQAIKKSAQNAIRMGLGGTLIGIVTGWLFSNLIWGFIIWLAMISACILAYGGFAVIRHFVVRYQLYLGNCIPWDYASFLDYAADRTLLTKVGGGYRFYHRELAKHFVESEY